MTDSGSGKVSDPEAGVKFVAPSTFPRKDSFKFGHVPVSEIASIQRKPSVSSDESPRQSQSMDCSPPSHTASDHINVKQRTMMASRHSSRNAPSTPQKIERRRSFLDKYSDVEEDQEIGTSKS
ncbi:hypothetical protein Ddc_13120 [Ditylenchus destructor]|nr:hypothetical protein Ddc_13120 [Ditylenchus destructor]